MDVVGRMDLLEFLHKECEEQGVTIVYATHIFDGLEEWLTHIVYVEDGELIRSGPITDFLAADMRAGRRLSATVQGWLKQWRSTRQEQGLKEPGRQEMTTVLPSRHMAFFR